MVEIDPELPPEGDLMDELSDSDDEEIVEVQIHPNELEELVQELKLLGADLETEISLAQPLNTSGIKDDVFYGESIEQEVLEYNDDQYYDDPIYQDDQDDQVYQEDSVYQNDSIYQNDPIFQEGRNYQEDSIFNDHKGCQFCEL